MAPAKQLRRWAKASIKRYAMTGRRVAGCHSLYSADKNIVEIIDGLRIVNPFG